MKTDSELIRYAHARLISTSKYTKAFTFLKERILDGVNDKDILLEFNSLHEAMPEVFSISGGNELSKEVLRKFRKGVEANKSRTDAKRERAIENGIRMTDEADAWKDSSPAFNLVKKRLAEGVSYNDIITEMDNLYSAEPGEYCTRQGKQVTKATLSNWAKILGYDTTNGGKSKDKATEWRENSEGYQWFRKQILAGIQQDIIIQEFNTLHCSNPEAYSTMLGSGMTVSTYTRWRREVLSEHNRK